MARSPTAKAKECAELLLLSLYVLIPPSRGMEIRTLEILPHELCLQSPYLCDKNLIHVDENGKVTFRFQSYKTKKKYGVDTTILQVRYAMPL